MTALILWLTFRWKFDRNGLPHVSRETATKKFKASIRAFTDWIKKA